MSLPADVALNGHYSWGQRLTFDEPESRPDEMTAAVRDWFTTLQHNLPTPMGPAQLDDWLRMLARLPYASVRNTILLSGQCPDVAELRTYDGWAATRAGETVSGLRGASAIWVWDPVVARKCPGCGRGHYAHDVEHDDEPVACTEVPPHRWSVDVVETTPTPVFADSQLDGATGEASTSFGVRPPTAGPEDHRPDLSEDAMATPDPGRVPRIDSPGELVSVLEAAAGELPLRLSLEDGDAWSFLEPVVVGGRDTYTLSPTVRGDGSASPARLSAGLLRAFGEVLVAPDLTDTATLRQRRVEASGIAYAAAIALGHGTRFELPVGAPTDLDAWGHDDDATLRGRCRRIRQGVASVLEAVIAV